MISVAIVALLLSLPGPLVELGAMLGSIMAVLVLVPAGLAPAGRRVWVASWALALHQVVILTWLGCWRATLIRQPLGPTDNSDYLNLILELPYILLVLSLFYVPLLTLSGLVVIAIGSPRLPLTQDQLLLTLATMVLCWMLTLALLAADPFQLYDWVRD